MDKEIIVPCQNGVAGFNEYFELYKKGLKTYNAF
jgi:hypothetical protein